MIKLFPLLLLCIPVFALAQHTQFDGVNAEDAEALKKAVPEIVSDPPPMWSVDEAIRFLMGTGRYEDVEVHSLILPEGNTAKIIGVPIRRVSTIHVAGNKALSEQEILDIMNINEDQRLARQKILDAAENVKKTYRQKGYLNAIIRIGFRDLKGARTAVDIDVAEGDVCRVKEIIAETTNERLRKALGKELQVLLKEPLTESFQTRIQAIVTKYFIDEQYLNAQLSPIEMHVNDERTQAGVHFTIENPYQYDLVFNGRNDTEFYNIKTELGLKSGDRFGLSPGSEISDRIRQLYKKRGYASVEVVFSERQTPKDFKRQLIFDIKEGKKIEIEKIEISGRITRPSDHYSEYILEHSSELVGDGYYNAEDLETGYNNLVVSLQNEGFLKAKIQSVRTEFNSDKTGVNVQILMDEGPLTRVKEVIFEGLSSFPPEKLHEVIGFKKGDALRLALLENSAPELKKMYLSSGYLDFRVLNESDLITYSDDNTLATVRFEMREGPQVIVGTIMVEGNESTYPWVILKEIEFKPGEILTQEKIKDSELRLQRLGLFSTINIRMAEAGSNIAERTVFIQVVERNPGLVNLGLGLHNAVGGDLDLTLKAYAGVGYRNLWKRAHAASFRAEVNKPLNLNPTEQNAADQGLRNFVERNFNLGYRDPFLFGVRLRGNINLTNRVSITKRQADQVKANETNELALTTEYDLTRYWKLTWNAWSLAASRTFGVAGLVNEEKFNIGTIGPTLEWDKRDSPLLPTRGHYINVSTEYSHPSFGSTETINYIRNTANITKYVPLGLKSRLIWATQIRGGDIQNISTHPNGAVPEEKRFALGGVTSLRGYDYQQVPNEDEVKRQLGIASADPLNIRARSQFYVLKTELLFPIYGEFGGCVFYDGGGVKILDSRVSMQDEYRDAAGLGFRYNTPVGAVAIDIGWKLDRKDAEPPFHVHFSIGNF